MMSQMQQRAQEQFPMVLLTLLSIVQALALELLWEHIQQSTFLFSLSRAALAGWMQIGATALGITLIWVTYAGNAMRFRWTPSIGDSVYPFIIGILEFWQIALLAPEMVGQWTILTAVIFAAMVWVSHLIMRGARLSGENREFFDTREPATLRDFFPHMLVVLVLLLSGLAVWLTQASLMFSLLLIVAVQALLIWQFYSSIKFWNQTMRTGAGPLIQSG